MTQTLPPFTCLLVEDNRDHAELICLALKQESEDCTIDLVEDGSDALDYLYQRGKFNYVAQLPDIILLDLQLGQVSGFEVLKTIRADENLQHLTVFVLTTSGSDLDRMRAELLGVDQYMRKPADFHEFVCMIKHLQMYWIKSEVQQPNLRLASDG